MRIAWKISFGRLGAYANLANVVLLVLCGLVLWNCTISIQQAVQEPDVIGNAYVRVVSYGRDAFGQSYYFVLEHGQIWKMSSKSYLYVGQRAEVTGIFRKLYVDEEKHYITSQLGGGIAGEIKSARITSISTICDLSCKLLLHINQTQNYIARRYQEFNCLEFKQIVDFLSSTLSCNDVSTLSLGLVLGGGQSFSTSSKSNIQRLGLTHLVAVSGFQVILVASFIEYIASLSGLRASLRSCVVVIGILGLIGLVGLQAPVLRSAFSIIFSLLALKLFRRRLEGWRSLVYSGLFLLVVNPFYILSASFILSFLASCGLHSIGGLSFGKRFLWSQITELMVTTTIAFLWTLPEIIVLSGSVSPLGIISNIFILPIIPCITAINIIGLIPYIGNVFLYLGSLLETFVLIIINDIGPHVPKLQLVTFSTVEYVLYYIILWSLTRVLCGLRLKKHEPRPGK